MLEKMSQLSFFLLLLCLAISILAKQPLSDTAYSVPNCNQGSIHFDNLTESSGSYIPIINSEVDLCYTNDNYFEIKFVNRDYYIKNTYLNCNDYLYNQDVVEVFLGDPYVEAAPIHHYIEMEFSPKGVIYVAKIYNPNLNNSGIVHTYIDCNQSGIIVNTFVDPYHPVWTADIKIPFSLILADITERPLYMLGNIFRVDLFGDDSCQGQLYCDYLALNPTMVSPPSFHRPQNFVEFTMSTQQQ